jgi:hypothetical protein
MRDSASLNVGSYLGLPFAQHHDGGFNKKRRRRDNDYKIQLDVGANIGARNRAGPGRDRFSQWNVFNESLAGVSDQH